MPTSGKATAGITGFLGGFGGQLLSIRQQEHDEARQDFERRHNFGMEMLGREDLTPEGRQFWLGQVKGDFEGYGGKNKAFEPGGMFDAVDRLYGGQSRATAGQDKPLPGPAAIGGQDYVELGQQQQQGAPQPQPQAQAQQPKMFTTAPERERALMKVQADVQRTEQQRTLEETETAIDAEVAAGRMSPEQAAMAKVQNRTRMSTPRVQSERMVETEEKGFQPESKIGGLTSPQKADAWKSPFSKRFRNYTDMGLPEQEARDRAQADVEETERLDKRWKEERIRSQQALTAQRRNAAEGKSEFKISPSFALSVYQGAQRAAEKQAEFLFEVGKVGEEELQQTIDRITIEELQKRGVRTEEVMDVISIGMNQARTGQPLPRPPGAVNPGWRPGAASP